MCSSLRVLVHVRSQSRGPSGFYSLFERRSDLASKKIHVIISAEWGVGLPDAALGDLARDEFCTPRGKSSGLH